MSAIRAGYRATCAGCPDFIEPGDEVVFVDDEPVHVACEDAAITLLEVQKRSSSWGFDGPEGDDAA